MKFILLAATATVNSTFRKAERLREARHARFLLSRRIRDLKYVPVHQGGWRLEVVAGMRRSASTGGCERQRVTGRAAGAVVRPQVESALQVCRAVTVLVVAAARGIVRRVRG